MKNVSSSRVTSICNIACAVLMLILLVLQFMPFWTVETEEGANSVSIQSFIWFPGDHGDLEDSLGATLGNEEFSVNDVLGMPILVLVAGAAGVVLCLIKSGSGFASILPAICGVAGVWGFLAKPAFRLGSTWQIQLALSAVILVLAIVSIAAMIREARR